MGIQQELRNKVSTALANGVAVFAAEWGACEYSPYTGNGALDLGEVQTWLGFFEQHHISDVNWAISDKAESCSALVDGASRHGGWAEYQLTPSGVFVRASLRASTLAIPVPSAPTKVFANTITKVPALKHVAMTMIFIGASTVVAILAFSKMCRLPSTLGSVCSLHASRAPSAQNLLRTADAGK